MRTLFYKAQTSGNMWDTWLYWHEGVFYLFHLAGPGGQWPGIALATSDDGIHWLEHGMVLRKAEGVTWLGTGSVWESPLLGSGPRFILNFSEWRGDAQTIFFAESDNLLDWRRLDDTHEFHPDGRWYNATGGEQGRWDCIYTIDKPGGGLYGYWTANPLGFTGFGFGESADGVTWTALPPPILAWGDIEPLTSIESGAVAEIGGRFYTMLGTNVEYPPYSSGMFSFVADSPTGPFHPMAANFALLTSPAGRWHTYFARFLWVNSVLLVNHHAIAPNGEVYFAPLKLAVVDPLGVLRLKWWKGNDTVKSEWGETTHAYADAVSYDPSGGVLVEGILTIPADGPDSHSRSTEFSVSCGAGHQATRFRLQACGASEIDEIGADGEVHPIGRIDRALELSGTVPFRLLLMHYFAEFYLADHLIQVISLPAAPAGRLTVSGVVGVWRSWQP